MKAYEKPTMVKVGNPMYTKNGMSLDNFSQVRQDICGHAIPDLVEKYGSPLFVFSQQSLIDKYNAAYKAVSDQYKNVQFGWSYKTNYLRAVCQTFHRLGALAEVVSDFEYEKARNLGVDGSKIIYNGPYKTKESLLTAVNEGAIINIDHFGEIEDLESIALQLGREIAIGIRINCQTGIYPHWSRFGFNLESGHAIGAVRRIHDSPHLRLTGVHSHIGTFVIDHNAYKKAAEKVVEFMHIIEAITRTPITYLDLGGGFASLSRLKGVYQAPEIAIPSIEKYAQSITEPLKSLNDRINPPKLLMELGRHLVDEAGYLVTSVVADKILPDGRRSYVLDAGVNVLYTSSWYRFCVESATPLKGMLEPAILNGPLCMNIDVVDECIMLPRMSRGQQLVLSPVGAYNLTQSMQFIRYRPAAVMILESGEDIEIKRRETLADVENTESDLPFEQKLREIA